MIISSSRRAFSLVELSIVLVILGLLVGGILAGQSLIHAAELRSVSSDVTRYQAAISAFRDKYLGLPGDLPTAVRFWDAQGGSNTAAGYDSTCAALTTAATGMPTCNGNGDGRIGDTTGTYSYETFRFWQHLANAGLVEGRLSSIAGTGDARHMVPGTNVPRLRIGSAGISIEYQGAFVGTTGFFDGDYAHTMYLGNGKAGGANIIPFIKPEDAWNIDTKLDDGRPAYGMVRVYNSDRADNPNCASSNVAASATYKFTETGIACAVMVVNKL